MLARFATARVLVVDDNPANLALLKALLTRAGLEHVDTIANPCEALARLGELKPDLVLLDLHMPQMDGYAVLDQVTEHAAGNYLPVMVLTADARPEATQRALDRGARDFLTKPFDATEVTLRVRNLLETRSLHQALRQHNGRLRAELDGYWELERAQDEVRQSRRERVERVIRQGDISVVYQAVIDLRHGGIVGAEALSRFPSEPYRPPDRWFTDAAEVGLGTELELAAVRAALPALDEFPEQMFLAVNASPGALLSPDMDVVLDLRLRSRVVVELTEHVPVEDYDAMNSTTDALRDSSVRIAVDDTGAGYAGFQHLLGLRPDIVKLDMSLTRGIDTDPARRALASALVAFTRDTGALLIAEGIETATELETLTRLDVGCAQGYFLSRPQPLPAVLDLARATRLGTVG